MALSDFLINSSLVSYESSHIFLTETILDVLALLKLQCMPPLSHSEQISSSFTFLRGAKWSHEFLLQTQGSVQLPKLPLSFREDLTPSCLSESQAVTTSLFLMMNLFHCSQKRTLEKHISFTQFWNFFLFCRCLFLSSFPARRSLLPPPSYQYFHSGSDIYFLYLVALEIK